MVKTACYHCGEDCGENPVRFDEKDFCCSGCKTVYEILSKNDACAYYSFNDRPGKKAGNIETGERYAYLDLEEIRKELLVFSDGGISTVRFYIPIIHCSSCIWLLENLHKFNPGIAQSTVNFSKKEISITFKDNQVSLRQVVELLVSLNYTPEISLDNLKDKSRKKANLSIYYRLGVAGFCFGNIMLFSFPEYLAAGNTLEHFIQDYLRWLNLLFSLPVMFYAGTGYLVSAWKGLKKGFVSIDVPIAVGMIALFSRSAWEIVSNNGPGFMDSLSGLVFFLLVGKWYQGKTYDALSFERDYKSYFPVSATLIDELGKEQILPIKLLKAGHRILIRNQELIPADSLLVKGDGQIDYSFVSGESSPVAKQAGEKVFAGGRQLGGAIEVIVEKEVMQSYLTDLWNRKQGNREMSSTMSKLMDKLGRNFTIAIILISAGTALSWAVLDPSVIMNAFTSVLIVACPCALALTVPFAFGNTMRIFGRKGFYIKQSEVVEILAKTDTIVFDKTGTLTQNDQYELDFSNLDHNPATLQAVRSLVRQSTHPVSTAIYRGLEEVSVSEIPDFEEVVSKGIRGTFKGIRYSLGSASFTGSSDKTVNADASQVYVSADGHSLGYIQLSNKYRPGIEEVIRNLNKDFSLHVLSGDNQAEEQNLRRMFGPDAELHFFQSPHDKLNYIKALREKGKHVLMVGDGLNDAGALQEADAGISIADEVYHFSPACDAILDSTQFKNLSRFLRFTHTSIRVVKASIFISLIYNLSGIAIAAAGLLTPVIAAVLMPLSSVSVVAFVSLSVRMAARRGI